MSDDSSSLENLPSLDSGKPRRSRINWEKVGPVTSIVLVVLTLGLVVLTTLLLEQKAVPASVPTVRPTINIAAPPEPIQRCLTLSGTATVPKGYTVWMAQHGASESAFYNLAEVTPTAGNGWTVTMNVGTAQDTNDNFVLYAFALDPEATQVLTAIETSPVQAFYYLKSLPTQAGEHASVAVERNDSSIAPCPS
jgi:hypothetical protein